MEDEDRETTGRAIEHGGALIEARQKWGEHPAGWLDLSTGINPVPYPVGDIPQDVWSRLPEETAVAGLIEIARRYFKAPDRAGMVAAAGSQALIGSLPGLLSPRHISVLGPAYAEHAHRWRLAGHHVAVTAKLSEAANADVAVVINPNNPDGRVISSDTLGEIAHEMRSRGGLLVVDEAFADLRPDISLAPYTSAPGLIVLRSFGKFFGLAGLRLGFAICDTRLARDWAEFLGLWTISGPALHIGAKAMADEAWIVSERQRLAAASSRLRTILVAAKLEIKGSTDLFTLVKTPAAQSLKNHLCSEGILVRTFEEEPQWLRFGLPADDTAPNRLARALDRFQT